jgi:hypothetical protein
MKNCHNDKKLDEAIGKVLRLTLKNGKECTGILGYSDFSNEYKLEVIDESFSVYFYKSHVKKFEVLYG